MFCQNCESNKATNHIHTVVNGVVTDMYLCSECAKSINKSFQSDDMFGLLSSFLKSTVEPTAKKITCECCGCSFGDISKTGKVGCGNCYKTFIKQLEPALVRLHGRTNHLGKRNANMNNAESKINTEKNDDLGEVEKLKRELKTAIEKEEYEKAAVLRDEIKKISGDK